MAMKGQQDEPFPEPELMGSTMVMNSTHSVQEWDHLQSKVREMETEIRVLQEGMDAMVSDLASLELVAHENYEAKVRAERELSRLTEREGFHLALQQMSPFKKPTRGVQTKITSDPDQADIEASLDAQFQEREAQLLQRCETAEAIAKGYRQRGESAEAELQTAETTIISLQQQNQTQLDEIKRLAAKQHQLENPPEADGPCQTAKVDQLQSLVKFYKTNSERASRDIKDLRTKLKTNQRAPQGAPVLRPRS